MEENKPIEERVIDRVSRDLPVPYDEEDIHPEDVIRSYLITNNIAETAKALGIGYRKTRNIIRSDYAKEAIDRVFDALGAGDGKVIRVYIDALDAMSPDAITPDHNTRMKAAETILRMKGLLTKIEVNAIQNNVISDAVANDLREFVKSRDSKMVEFIEEKAEG